MAATTGHFDRLVLIYWVGIFLRGNQMNLGLAVADEAASAFSSPLRYPGGKQKAINAIAPMLPNHSSIYEYREPMVGGGSMFFHMRSLGIGHQYWINDKFTDLATFWQVAQNPQLCARL